VQDILTYLTKKAKTYKFIGMRNIKHYIVFPIFAAAILLIFSGCSRENIQTKTVIDDNLLQEAITYGKSKAGVSDYEFMEPWSIYLGYEVGKGRVVYYTPFLHAAHLAKNAADKHLKPDINIIKKAVSSKANTLNFLILVYGNDPEAPRRIHTYLIYNNMKIEPVYKHFPSYGEFNRDYYQQINGEVRFPRKGIPDNATVNLCVEILPSEKEHKEDVHEHHNDESTITVGEQISQHTKSVFTFNLSKYR